MPSKNEKILGISQNTFGRALYGRNARSIIIVGSRKAVRNQLLTQIGELAKHQGLYTSTVTASKSHCFTHLFFEQISYVISSSSAADHMQHPIQLARKALENFAVMYKVPIQGEVLEINTELGIADSGDLQLDLADLFLLLGKALQTENTGWVILFSEMHQLPKAELEAIITALHKVAQERLPIVLVGTGLPTLRGKCGNAKPYSERLFMYEEVEL